MPAKTEKQRRFIWAIRRKYGTRKNAPKKWKWVFGEEWSHLAKESHILNFNQFNEAMGTLSKNDTDELEDLCLSFVEEWNLKTSWDENDYEPFEKFGYLSIQRFDKFHIQFSVQIYVKKGEWSKIQAKFESDLRLLINRINKFGFEVMEITWGSSIELNRYSCSKIEYDAHTFSFQISHTDEKSEEILGYTNESFLPRKEHYRILKTVKALVGIN